MYNNTPQDTIYIVQPILQRDTVPEASPPGRVLELVDPRCLPRGGRRSEKRMGQSESRTRRPTGQGQAEGVLLCVRACPCVCVRRALSPISAPGKELFKLVSHLSQAALKLLTRSIHERCLEGHPKVSYSTTEQHPQHTNPIDESKR